MKHTFETGRLTLQLICPADADFILQLLNTDGWLQFIGNKQVYTQNDAIHYIDKILATENLYYWTVKLKPDDAPAGLVTYLKRNYLPHFDIGFAFLPCYQGTGYAFEATSAILAYVSTKLQHETVLAITVAGNTASIKLLERLNFSYEKTIETENGTLLVYACKTNGSAIRKSVPEAG
ncbi:N-acetyltransferase [Sphingobacteriales bacterium UPWRP_1]|nr:hypothetical protein BVG80_16545 [Sphingobacteriales bacterium TSM_CSM]PSJ74605.1 N-acetyltransferase [Sphingobacteriales bacterium UPWRP_1]